MKVYGVLLRGGRMPEQFDLVPLDMYHEFRRKVRTIRCPVLFEDD